MQRHFCFLPLWVEKKDQARKTSATRKLRTKFGILRADAKHSQRVGCGARVGDGGGVDDLEGDLVSGRGVGTGNGKTGGDADGVRDEKEIAHSHARGGQRTDNRLGRTGDGGVGTRDSVNLDLAAVSVSDDTERGTDGGSGRHNFEEFRGW